MNPKIHFPNTTSSSSAVHSSCVSLKGLAKVKHILLSLIGIAFLLHISASGIFAADKPNVVIFFTDDQGTLDVNCYGAKDLHTPNMDKLAETGVRFTQAYAHTVCCPSRGALLTGRHPNRGGVQNWLQGDRNGADSQNSNNLNSNSY